MYCFAALTQALIPSWKTCSRLRASKVLLRNHRGTYFQLFLFMYSLMPSYMNSLEIFFEIFRNGSIHFFFLFSFWKNNSFENFLLTFQRSDLSALTRKRKGANEIEGKLFLNCFLILGVDFYFQIDSIIVYGILYLLFFHLSK